MILIKEIIKKILSLTLWSCKNIKICTYFCNSSEEVFVIKKVKDTVPWTYVVSNLKCEEIVGAFYKKELQKTS